MSSSSQLQDHGYNQEEMYFHKLDQELIQKMKQTQKSVPGKAPPNQQNSTKVIPLLPAQNHKKAA